MTRQKIHLINPLTSFSGGSEWRTLNLYNELKDHADVTLWCDGSPDPNIASQYPVRHLSGKRLSFPRSGTLVFMGVYFRPANWIWLSRPERVIVLYNTPDRDKLDSLLRRSRFAFRPKPELVYCSALSEAEVGIPGRVETSIVDLNSFPAKDRQAERPFTVGRLSRANHLKHHPEDVEFYKRLARAGCRVKVMGATPEMIATFSADSTIEMLPPNAIPAPEFMQELDAFFYRTDPAWIEPWGRVIIEAMASELPIVGNEGGYTSIIKTGENGFLFTSEDEAFDIIMRLKGSTALRKSVGSAARDTVSRLITAEMKRDIVDYYLGSPL